MAVSLPYTALHQPVIVITDLALPRPPPKSRSRARQKNETPLFMNQFFGQKVTACCLCLPQLLPLRPLSRSPPLPPPAPTPTWPLSVLF